MIDEIQVKNLALIKQASLVPAQGLTVLTGETGAGKTALLSALKLLMGSRADQGFRAGMARMAWRSAGVSSGFPARPRMAVSRVKTKMSWWPCAAWAPMALSRHA